MLCMKQKKWYIIVIQSNYSRTSSNWVERRKCHYFNYVNFPFQMRPKSRKSNESDASSKLLSTSMKPQTKSRSSESLGKSIDASGKRSPLAHHLLNTTRTRSVRLRRAPGSEESLGQTSQRRFTRQGAKANLFSGTSQVTSQPKYQ